MRNLKSMKILLIALLFMVVIGMGINSFATDAPANTVNRIVVIGNDTTNTVVNTTTNTANTTNTTNVINVIGNATANSTYQNTSLPNTGSSDYTILILVAVCVVSAIYAYKKIRDYKNV